MDRNSEEYEAVRRTIQNLGENALAGIQTPRRQWPKTYVTEYGINNLYKIDLPLGRRLTYTIVANDGNLSVIILDYFRSHKEYETFFNY